MEEFGKGTGTQWPDLSKGSMESEAGVSRCKSRHDITESEALIMMQYAPGHTWTSYILFEIFEKSDSTGNRPQARPPKHTTTDGCQEGREVYTLRDVKTGFESRPRYKLSTRCFASSVPSLGWMLNGCPIRQH